MQQKSISYFLQLKIFFVFILFISCNSPSSDKVAEKKYTHPCGCVLTDEQMIMQCPVDAIGDSVIICKVGTNNVIGSGRGPMTWPEYIGSEYNGGEGLLVDCKTGKSLISELKDRELSYKNKQLIVDKRFPFDVYDPKKQTWVNLDLPVWRVRVFATNNILNLAPDSLILKPAFHGKAAFIQVDKDFETESKRTDHYMITNLVNRLLSCSLCGDKVSEERLLNIEKDFSEYYASHEDSKILLDERLGIYKAYKSYLDRGGKRVYYDLSKFVYF